MDYLIERLVERTEEHVNRTIYDAYKRIYESIEYYIYD